MPIGREPGEAGTPGSRWAPGSKAWWDQIRLSVFKVTDVLSQYKKQRHRNTWQGMPPPRTSSESIGSAPAR